MKKYIISVLFICFFCVANVNAKTTFLPDWLGGDIKRTTSDYNFNIDEPRCIDAVDRYGNRLYHKATGCPAPKIFDEYCPFDDEYISKCYCPPVFNKTCNSPYKGDPRIKDTNTNYANCDDLWVSCCDSRCPAGTSKTDPGGCGGSTTNDCGETCYYPYVACCTPLADETDCNYGTKQCSDGCGGTRTCCKSCSPLTNETNCDYGTHSCSNGCGGTRTCCNACSPLPDEPNCAFGTGACSDGCGGTRACCCDENDRNCACPGFIYCDPATKIGDGPTCSDGTNTYYERCLVKENCNNQPYNESDGYCTTSTYGNVYYVKDKCTTQTGVTYKYYGSCTGYSVNSYKDCMGNIAPCKGMKLCDGDNGVGEPCECGGKKYFTQCAANECNDSNIYADGTSILSGYCWVTNNDNKKNAGGYYYVKDKCVNSSGQTLFGYMSCNADNQDCNGRTPPCSGKKSCKDDEGIGLCECGGKKYFDECTEKCTTDSEYLNGVLHSAETESSILFSAGYYKVQLKCTMKDNTNVYYYESCSATKIDGAGNDAPCKNMQKCSSKYIGLGEACSCGGETYYESCASICNYEETVESCTQQGKGFSQKCYGVNSKLVQTWYGECI